MKTLKIDLRNRCVREKCNKLIGKSKMKIANYDLYKPYCSYHCQEWHRLESAQNYINAQPKNIRQTRR